MREIKFRAWIKEEKLMIYPNDKEHDFCMICNGYGFGIVYQDSDWLKDSDFEIMQYTGLKDKNGKEIFEGDIVIATYGKWLEEKEGIKRICSIVYDKISCAFKMAVKDSRVLVSFDDSKRTDIRIIGNIYEKVEGEVERLKQYIYKSGFCGYTGVDYDYHKIDCEKCFDRETCERYQIVKEGWNE
jgi:uncharacterized phage protein (TIGR01671 family)